MSGSRRVLVTGAAGFIGMHTAVRAARPRRRGRRRRQPRPVLRRRAQGGAAAPARRTRRIRVRAPRPRGCRRDRAAVPRRRGSTASSTSRRSRACATRSSIRRAYVDANLDAFGNVLEGCRHARVRHLVYASSSFGLRRATTRCRSPRTEPVDHPVSLYAATKKAERADGAQLQPPLRAADDGPALLHRLRPVGAAGHGADAVHRAILAGEPIEVFNHGRMQRDFTYVDDIVEGVVARARPPAGARDPATGAPYRVYNIGNHEPVELDEFIATLERSARPDREARPAADAAGRRAGDLRVDRRPARGHRIRAQRTPLAEGSRGSSPGTAITTGPDGRAVAGGGGGRW